MEMVVHGDCYLKVDEYTKILLASKQHFPDPNIEQTFIYFIHFLMKINYLIYLRKVELMLQP